MSETLLVLVGPTGIGKSAIAMQLAQRLQCPIVNADSRQIFKEIPIGTAAPTTEQQQLVTHYFVATKSITDDYSAAQYERECLQLLENLPKTSNPFAILTGGSTLYIHAVCNGLDEIPTINQNTREKIRKIYKENGLEALQQLLIERDEHYWQTIDQRNPQRLIHALEVIEQTGRSLTSFWDNAPKKRPFRIVKIGLTQAREKLYHKINQRTIQMLANGWLDEARRVYPLRHLNSLNTVGYKELFDFLDGKLTRQDTIEKIQQHTRNYAKRQLTWFRKDSEITWLNLDDLPYDALLQTINDMLKTHS